MVSSNVLSELERFGLSQKEAQVYMACLSLGIANVQQIADQSGIKRVTTYVILDSLLNFGLVSQVTRAKKTLYEAESPRNLGRMLDTRQRELTDQRDTLNHLLPQLEAIKAGGSEPASAKFYDTPEGIRSALGLFLDRAMRHSPKAVCGITNLDEVNEHFAEFPVASNEPRLAELGINGRLVYTSKEKPSQNNREQSKNLMTRWLPTNEFPMHGDFTVAGDNILMLSVTAQKPVAILISSGPLALGLTAIFEQLWEAAVHRDRRKA